MEFYKTYKIADKLLMKSVLSFYIHIKRKSNAKLFAFDFNLDSEYNGIRRIP